jgi:hypothetical protein
MRTMLIGAFAAAAMSILASGTAQAYAPARETASQIVPQPRSGSAVILADRSQSKGRPPGWSQGEKTGWGSGRRPPGQRR